MSFEPRKKPNDLPWIKELQTVTEVIFERALEAGYTVPELAERAGLSPTTVRNLLNWTVVYPRFNTLALLARAVGYVLTATEKRAKLSKAS